jgi:hypothetical protein
MITPLQLQSLRPSNWTHVDSGLAASHRVAVLGDGATWGRYRDRDQFRVGLGALVDHGLGRCLRQFLRGRVLGLLGSPVGSW